jgi:hypothetical protein
MTNIDIIGWIVVAIICLVVPFLVGAVIHEGTRDPDEDERT